MLRCDCTVNVYIHQFTSYLSCYCDIWTLIYFCFHFFSLIVKFLAKGVSTVIVSQEKDAVLPCSNVGKYSESSYRVRWLKDGKEMVIPTRPPNAEHVKWEPDRKVSLLLMNVQKSDEGLYRCEIWHGWERIHVKNISLKIKGKIWFSSCKFSRKPRVT